MLKEKKETLEALMNMLNEENAKRIKVMVQGDSPEQVKEGLEAAEEKMEEIPEMAEESSEAPMEGGDETDDILSKLTPEQKQKLLEKLGN